MTQQDLFTTTPTASERTIDPADQADLRAWLMSHGWQHRAELSAGLGWDDRKVRLIVESLGTDVVRCQCGFKLTDSLNREDVSAALQACDAFESQARKNLDYSLKLRRRLHPLVG